LRRKESQVACKFDKKSIPNILPASSVVLFRRRYGRFRRARGQ
jgi:hypothetical protein